MIIEDATFVPFPCIAIKTKTVSTIDIIKPFERITTGCNRKCPCRVWHQCNYYNKIKWKKSRADKDEHIWEYYNNIFRITYDMPITNMNG